MENYEYILNRIVQRIEDRNNTKRLEKAVDDRKNRLEIKETKSKECLERRWMDNLLEGMECLELGSFEGEWSEHKMLEEWMLNA